MIDLIILSVTNGNGHVLRYWNIYTEYIEYQVSDFSMVSLKMKPTDKYFLYF